MVKEIFRIVIPGDPVAKQSAKHRVTKQGKIHSYQPAHVVGWSNFARGLIYAKWGNKPLLDEPLFLTIKAHFKAPQSLRARQKQLIKDGHSVLKSTAPDCDNVAKNVTDALEGIVVKNDSRIVGLHIMKLYNDKPNVLVVIEEFENGD